MWYSSCHDNEPKPDMVIHEEIQHDYSARDQFGHDENTIQRATCYSAVSYPGRYCYSRSPYGQQSMFPVPMRRYSAPPISRRVECKVFKGGHPSTTPPESKRHIAFFSPRVTNSMPPNPNCYRSIALPNGNNILAQRLSDGSLYRGYNPQYLMGNTIESVHQKAHLSRIVSEKMSENYFQVKLPLQELQNRNKFDEKNVTESKMLEEMGDINSNGIQNAAADAAEILLGLRTLPCPTSTTKKTIRQRSNKAYEFGHQKHLSPPDRLSVPEDVSKLNSMHCFLRSDLLELFVIESTDFSHSLVSRDENICEKTSGKDTTSRRVGLRCVHCAKDRLRYSSVKDEAPMAVFYPKCISELYRLATSWQRVHLRKCRNIPPSVLDTYYKTKEDKSRGKTQWWITSARKIGLVDSNSKGGGICFVTTSGGEPTFDSNIDAVIPPRDC
jgi:hypothetical protein